MKVTFNKSELKNFVQFCKSNYVSKISFLENHILACFDNGEILFSVNSSKGNYFVEEDVPQFASVFCKELDDKESVVLDFENEKITFDSGYCFNLFSSGSSSSDNEEGPDTVEGPNIVKVASFTKDTLKSNFEKDFVISRSNCFKKIAMVGCGLSASAGVFTKTAPGTILYKIGEVKAELESKTFASHDSPINFSRAACIFTENMYNVIMSIDFTHAAMSIPMDPNDSDVMGTMIVDTDSEKITFRNVYIQKAKAEKNYAKIVSSPAVKNVVLTKKAIDEIIKTYFVCPNSKNDDDQMVILSFKDASVTPIIQSILQKPIENASSDEKKICFDVEALKYLNSVIDSDNINIAVKNDNSFTGDQKEEFCCISGDNGSTYIFKNSVSEEND
jgi:hypothetical protein